MQSRLVEQKDSRAVQTSVRSPEREPVSATHIDMKGRAAPVRQQGNFNLTCPVLGVSQPCCVSRRRAPMRFTYPRPQGPAIFQRQGRIVLNEGPQGGSDVRGRDRGINRDAPQGGCCAVEEATPVAGHSQDPGRQGQEWRCSCRAVGNLGRQWRSCRHGSRLSSLTPTAPARRATVPVPAPRWPAPRGSQPT